MGISDSGADEVADGSGGDVVTDSVANTRTISITIHRGTIGLADPGPNFTNNNADNQWRDLVANRGVGNISTDWFREVARALGISIQEPTFIGTDNFSNALVASTHGSATLGDACGVPAIFYGGTTRCFVAFATARRLSATSKTRRILLTF